MLAYISGSITLSELKVQAGVFNSWKSVYNCCLNMHVHVHVCVCVCLFNFGRL